MGINRITLKEDAKAAVAGAVPSAAAVTLVYLIASYVIGAIDVRLLTMTGFTWEAVYYDTFVPVWSMTVLVACLLYLAVVIVSNVITIGYKAYCLGISRGREMSYGSLLDGFRFFGKIILIAILQSVFVFLWSLLFIIPGIIAAYRYSQAYYIMLDNPNMGAVDCIRASSEMMRGHKLDYFVLELSFLGWHILCGLTLGILYIWKMPYFEVTFANFYGAVSDRGPRDAGGPQNKNGENPTQNNLPWEL